MRDSDTVPNGYSGSIKIGTLRNIMRGEIPKGMSDFQLSEFIPFRTETLRKMAETLHCSADYLLGLVNEPCAVVGPPPMPEPGQLTLGCWMPGGTNPAHPCDCIVILNLDSPETPGKTIRQQAYWQHGSFWFSKTSSNAIDLPILAWLEIPKWEGGKTND